MPTFDGNVFDSAVFDTLFGIPGLLKIQVQPEYRKIVSGQVVVITAYIVNLRDPRRRYLFNPEVPPTFSLFYPDRSVKFSNIAMRNVDVGIYQLEHQTGVVFDSTVFDPVVFDTETNDPAGVYTGSVFCRDGNTTLSSIPQEIYEVING